MKNIKIMIFGLCAVMPMQASDRSSWALCLGAGCAAGTVAAYATTKLMYGQSLWPLRGVKQDESVEVVKARIALEELKASKIQELEGSVMSLNTVLGAAQEKISSNAAAVVALQQKIAFLSSASSSSQKRFVVQAPKSPRLLLSASGFDSTSDEDESEVVLPGVVTAAAVSAVQEASLPQSSGPQRQRRVGVSAGVVPVGQPALSANVGESVNTIQ